MNTLECIKSRRSSNQFLDKEISNEDLDTILEAGRWAPSGLNNQPWRFLIIHNDDHRKQSLEDCTKYVDTIKSANILIVVLLNRYRMYNEIRDHQSVGACIQNMMLAAHELGLGGVWLGEILNRESTVLERLNIAPGTYALAGVVALGYADPDEIHEADRKPLAELTL